MLQFYILLRCQNHRLLRDVRRRLSATEPLDLFFLEARIVGCNAFCAR